MNNFIDIRNQLLNNYFFDFSYLIYKDACYHSFSINNFIKTLKIDIQPEQFYNYQTKVNDYNINLKTRKLEKTFSLYKVKETQNHNISEFINLYIDVYYPYQNYFYKNLKSVKKSFSMEYVISNLNKNAATKKYYSNVIINKNTIDFIVILEESMLNNVSRFIYSFSVENSKITNKKLESERNTTNDFVNSFNKYGFVQEDLITEQDLYHDGGWNFSFLLKHLTKSNIEKIEKNALIIYGNNFN